MKRTTNHGFLSTEIIPIIAITGFFAYPIFFPRLDRVLIENADHAGCTNNPGEIAQVGNLYQEENEALPARDGLDFHDRGDEILAYDQDATSHPPSRQFAQDASEIPLVADREPYDTFRGTPGRKVCGCPEDESWSPGWCLTVMLMMKGHICSGLKDEPWAFMDERTLRSVLLAD